MPTDPEHLERVRREREFFARHATSGSELSWAETKPIAPLRREVRAGRIAEAARIRPGRGQRVLDIGCGTASYTLPLARQTAASIISIDVTPELLAEAAKVVPRNVRLAAADAVTLPFPDHSFDAVLGNAILHHLPLERCLPELLRVLKPGGRFCFAEPNYVNPHVFALLSVPWLRERGGVTPDETAFVRWPLRRALSQLGLAEIEIRPFDFLYPIVPLSWAPVLQALGRVLEATPGLREVAGSLLVCGAKPG